LVFDAEEIRHVGFEIGDGDFRSAAMQVAASQPLAISYKISIVDKVTLLVDLVFQLKDISVLPMGFAVFLVV